MCIRDRKKEKSPRKEGNLPEEVPDGVPALSREEEKQQRIDASIEKDIASFLHWTIATADSEVFLDEIGTARAATGKVPDGSLRLWMMEGINYKEAHEKFAANQHKPFSWQRCGAIPAISDDDVFLWQTAMSRFFNWTDAREAVWWSSAGIAANDKSCTKMFKKLGLVMDLPWTLVLSLIHI